MGIIKVLSPHEAQKIAAGEVVDRPANIVKELIENALDAGSTEISIWVEDGGRKRIEIHDNGSGMQPDDARLSITRHSTSKINSIDDLETITSFGFRGEALASITSVSKTTLITKYQENSEGLLLTIEGGTIINEKPHAHKGGTSLIVDEILYNVPARKKFLRSAATELRAVIHLIHAFSLAFTHVHFKLFSQGTLLYNMLPTNRPTGRMLSCTTSLKETDLIELTPITQHSTTISGFISHHHYARFDRSQIFFYVNKRPIKHPKLSSVLMKAYNNVLPPQKFPVAALFITLDPKEVDINVHPRKEEVAFANQKTVETLVYSAIQKALTHYAMRPLPSPVPYEEKQRFSYGQPFSFTSTLQPYTAHPSLEKPVFSISQAQQASLQESWFDMATSPEIEQTLAQPRPPLPQQTRPYTLIGQLHKTYIIIEQESGTTFIDAHAAHERILYERFGQKLQKQEATALLFPHIIELSKDSVHMLEPHKQLFEQYGLIIEPFGDEKIIISATPAGFQHIDYHDLIKNIIVWLEESADLNREELHEAITHKTQAMMACKAAVKAGDALNQEKMYEIIDQLLTCSQMLTCPHGRPTTWPLSWYEFEKKFKRKV